MNLTLAFIIWSVYLFGAGIILRHFFPQLNKQEVKQNGKIE